MSDDTSAFRPDEFDEDGIPSVAAVRRVCPNHTNGMPDAEVLRLGKALAAFTQVFAEIFQRKAEEQMEANAEKYVKKLARKQNQPAKPKRKRSSMHLAPT